MTSKTKKPRRKRGSKKIKEYTSCPNMGTPMLIGDFKAQNNRCIIKARCKLWNCPYCAEINKSEHFNRIATGIQKLIDRGVVFSFVTITCHEKWRGYNASIKNWRGSRDKLLARFRRRYAQDTDGTSHYVYIPEYHTDGTLHIHGIFAGNFKTKWWKDNARACGLGFMAKAERLTTALQAINYVIKYVTKQVGTAQPSKGFRRINYSKSFPTVQRNLLAGDWRKFERGESIQDVIVDGIVKGLTVKFDGTDFKTFDDLH